MKCPACKAELQEGYCGPIRSGAPGSACTDALVWDCGSCGSGFLPQYAGATESDMPHYYNGELAATDLARARRKALPDAERWLERIGKERFAHQHVLDIGCGTGQFLALLKQPQCYLAGVEVSQSLRESVETDICPCVSDVNQIDSGSITVATCFDVLEHSSDPDRLLQSIHDVLTPSGRLFIGVPNNDDYLKSIVAEYLSFFYHTSHLIYFSPNGLSSALRRNGFSIVESGFVHKYDLMNLVVWTRDRTWGGGDGPFDANSDQALARSLERQGIASHILVEAQKVES